MPPPQHCHLLVVEDDRDLRESVMESLEDAGFSVAGASDGLRAFEYLRGPSRRPDLILLDLMMPNMDGFQFREEQMKTAEYSAIPVAMLTADSNAKSKAMLLQVAGVMRKPLKMEALIELVGRVLNSPDGVQGEARKP